MKTKKITIACDEQDTYQSLINKVKNGFGFLEFTGSNLNALIEGFLTLRFPEEAITDLYLANDEVILLELREASKLEYNLLHFLILAVEQGNAALDAKNLPPAIFLLVK